MQVYYYLIDKVLLHLNEKLLEITDEIAEHQFN